MDRVVTCLGHSWHFRSAASDIIGLGGGMRVSADLRTSVLAGQ